MPGLARHFASVTSWPSHRPLVKAGVLTHLCQRGVLSPSALLNTRSLQHLDQAAKSVSPLARQVAAVWPGRCAEKATSPVFSSRGGTECPHKWIIANPDSGARWRTGGLGSPPEFNDMRDKQQRRWGLFWSQRV